MTRAAWLAVVVLVSACRDRSSKPAPKPTPPQPAALDAAPAPPPTAPDAGIAATDDARRFDCGADTDCVNSCQWGAVNRTWYEQASQRPGFPECQDGCANQQQRAEKAGDAPAMTNQGEGDGHCARTSGRLPPHGHHNDQ